MNLNFNDMFLLILISSFFFGFGLGLVGAFHRNLIEKEKRLLNKKFKEKFMNF